MSSPEPVNGASELPVPFQAVNSLMQIEEMRERFEQSLATQPRDSASLDLANLAGVAYLLGDGPLALTTLSAALEVVDAPQNQYLRGYLLNIQGAALCHIGSYKEARVAFERAEEQFTKTGDLLGMAWMQHLMAREMARDQNEHARALQLSNSALSVLRSRSTPDTVVEILLTQVDCLMRIGEMRRARDLMQQIDQMITENKCYFHRPEYYLLRAQLTLFESNFKQAWQHCYSGLGAVSDMGDLRMLTPLYTALASALEYDRNRIDDARDALERAISAGRARARRLHLAMALRQMGMHLRRYFNRPTVRARGSGYLYEADQQFTQMGLAAIHNNKKLITQTMFPETSAEM